MKNTSKLTVAYILLLCLFATPAAVLRGVACLTDFNETTMHFDDGRLINIANAIAIVGVFILFSYIFTADKGVSYLPTFDGARTYVPAGLLGAALIFMSADTIAMPISKDITDKTIRGLYIAIAITALAAAIGLVLTILIQKEKSTVRAAFTLATVVFLTVYAAYLYFNKAEQPTNAPNKIVDQMAYLFSAIFFLYETRLSLGRAMWRAYTAFGLVAVLLTFYSALPTLAVYFISGRTLFDSLTASLLTLTLSIFIFSRIRLTLSLVSGDACPISKAIKDLAEKRRMELDEKRRLELEAMEDINNKDEIESGEDEPLSNYEIELPTIEEQIAAEDVTQTREKENDSVSEQP